MNKPPYELSIWQDIRNENSSAFSEKKLAILSSDTMDSPYKAHNVALKEKINGQRDLSFSIAYKIFNEETNKLEDNPLFNLIKNENIIKLRRGAPYDFMGSTSSDIEEFLNKKDTENKWLDFFVKSIEKDSSTYIAKVTANEAYITELGRNGWSLVLNSELENNYGTVTELGGKVLENTDWEVDNSYNPKEFLTVPIAKINGTEEYTLYKFGEESTIVNNVSLNQIRFFYNDLEWINNEEEQKVGWYLKQQEEYQVLYSPTSFENLLVDENNLIVDDNFDMNYVLKVKPTGGATILHINGKQIVKAQLTKIEPVLDRVVNIYLDGKGKEVYQYDEIEYVTSEIAKDYLVNTSNFTSNDSWYDNSEMGQTSFPEATIYPEINYAEEFDPTAHNFYLNLKTDREDKTFYNIGPRYQRLEVTEGEEFRIQFEVHNDTAPSLSIKLEYRDDSGGTSTWQALTSDANLIKVEDKNIYYGILKANKTTSLGKSQYIRLAIKNNGTDVLLKEIHLIKELGVMYGETPTSTTVINPVYYQIVDGEPVYLSAENNYTPKYSENFSAVRHIEVSKSNYFNALQTLAETFNVWVGFKVGHYVDGRVVIDENGRRDKKVIFSQFSPHDKENYLGFSYGINIKSIQRTVNSDSITTKTIVQDNSQEYAEDGICSITRARNNPSGENFIYNFDYFVAQGFIDYNTLLKDFYGTNSSDFRYYPKISKINNELKGLVDDLNNYSNAEKIWQGYADTYQAAVDNINVQLAQRDAEIEAWQGGLDGIKDLVTARDYLAVQLNNYNDLLKTAIDIVTYNKEQYEALIEKQQELIESKRDLNKELYERYSRFIQEGTWTDNTYVDDDRYFYDAQVIAQVSAFPKVTYKINVIDLEGADDGYYRQYRIGERTFIEDPEFFGYEDLTVGVPETRATVTSIKTPKKVNIIVSETSTNLDNPSQNNITVQTYKNQYDELFQQIQATTQTLQYQQGVYNRAANAVEADGSIKVESLQAAFLNNAVTLAESSMGGVNINTEKGIEVTDPTKANQIVKIIPAGLFISSDGGQHWTAGVTGTGINASLITTGTLNAGNINIVSGADRLFNWSKTGITAYAQIQTGESISVDSNKYVKFNQYGLYSVDGMTSGMEESIEDYIKNPNHSPVEKVDYIKAHSSFSLTYKGLQLNGGNLQEDTVILSSQEGLLVQPFGNGQSDQQKEWVFKENYFDNGDGNIYNPIGEVYKTGDPIPAVSLGRWRDANNEINYGLRLRNKSGNVTLTADENGNLWLKDVIRLGNTENDAEVIIRGDGDSPDSLRFGAGNNFAVTQDGTLTALKAEITGTINANGGQLNYIKIGEKNIIKKATEEDRIVMSLGNGNTTITDDGILTTKNANIEGTIVANDGEFNGTINATSGNFSGKIKIGDKNFIQAPTAEDNTILSFGDGATKIFDDGTLKTGINFKVNPQGLVTANDINLTGTLNATNTELNGRLKVGDIILSNELNKIYKDNDWEINGDGTATFNNVKVRGEIKSSIFKKDTVSSIGGTLFLSPGVKLITTLEPNNGVIVLPKDIFGEEWNTVKEVIISWPDGRQEQTAPVNERELSINDTLIPGTTIISSDDSSTSIKMTAVDNNKSPSIILKGAAFDNDTEIRTVILGNLNGHLNGTKFGDINPGSGIYANNAYLEGRLYLPNAGITNEGDADDSIRIWAGTSANDREEAPFRVTHDGTLYASKGIFEGTVKATDSTFSGWLQTAGILIDDEEDTDELKNVFYVAYDRRGEKGFPRLEDMIVKIDKGGISIYEGGLQIYSDIAAKDEKTPYNLYTYPYIKAIDDSDFRLYTTRLNISDFSQNYGLKIDNGLLSFYSNEYNSDFITDESTLWGKTPDYVFGAKDNKFVIGTSTFENLYLNDGGITINSDLSLEGPSAHISDNTILFIGDNTRIKPYNGNDGKGFDIYI